MADRYLIASGDSSDPAIFDGGTFPTALDTLRTNGFTLTVDADFTVFRITNDIAGGATTAGGQLLLNDGVTLTAYEIFAAFGAQFVTYSGISNAVINAVVNIIPDVNSAKRTNILHNGSGMLTINGNIIPSVPPSSVMRHAFAVYVTGTGTLNFNGNVIGQNTTGSQPCAGILVENNSATVNVTGTIEGANEASIWLNSNCTLTIQGSVTAGSVNYNSVAVNANAGATIIVNGVVEGNNTAHAIYSPASTSIVVSGLVINSGLNAVYSRLIKFKSDQDTEFVSETDIVNQDRSLFTAGLLTGYPLEANVKESVTYGPVGEFTGTYPGINEFTDTVLAAIASIKAVP